MGFCWRLFIRPQELEKCGSGERVSDFLWVRMMLRDADAPLPFSMDPDGFPPTPCWLPSPRLKGYELQMAAEEKMYLAHRLPHAAWHLGQTSFLYPTAHSPACASSQVPPRLPPSFVQLIVQRVPEEPLDSIHCCALSCAESLLCGSLPGACSGPADEPLSLLLTFSAHTMSGTAGGRRCS